MPKDEAFSKAAATIEAGLPDPFLMDFQLARRLVTNHIITQGTDHVQKLDKVLKPGLVMEASTIASDDLLFKMNGK